MKKVFVLAALCFSLFIMPACDNDANDGTTKEVAAADVPSSVTSAFSAKYSTATDIKWEDATEDGKQTYKAKFALNGKKMKAEFDPNGVFLKEEEDN